MFSLHPRLAADTFPITESSLCSVLLMNNALFPWLILVPRRENIREIIDLTHADRHQLMDEIGFASKTMRDLTQAHKLNVAALGNMVPQLHVHVIARFGGDAAWPNPVWGMAGKTYTQEPDILVQLRNHYAD